MKPNCNCPEFLVAVSVETMRNSDAYTIANFVPSKELMFRAAQGVFHAVDWQGKTVAIVCGAGNNGGDGYALAGILMDSGVMSTIYTVSDKFSEDGAHYRDIAVQKGVKVRAFEENTDLKNYDIVVDCIFGTGFHGMPRGMAAEAIRAMNGSGAYVVSVDINSGMNGDTGEAELAVKSDLTVSIGFYKKGHFLGQAPMLIGDLVNVDIGIILLPNEP